MTFAAPTSAHEARRQRRERRREAWRAFRHAYPAFLKFVTALFVVLLAIDGWLLTRHVTYLHEIQRLRRGMTVAERQQSDLIVTTEQDKLRMAVALAKHQANWDPRLHLSIAIDSGRMYLERNGALLRDMRVVVASEHAPAAQGDTTSATTPRGERTIVDVRSGDAPALILDGGTRIYASDDTTSPVAPGDIRVGVSDFNAILPNIGAGTNVYLY